MRITEQELQQLIKREYSRALREAKKTPSSGPIHKGVAVGRSRRVSGKAGPEVYELDPANLIQFAKAYVAMGSAVQEQLDDLLDQGPDAECNPNAVELMKEKLGGFNEVLDDALEEWGSSYGRDGSLEPEDEGIPTPAQRGRKGW